MKSPIVLISASSSDDTKFIIKGITKDKEEQLEPSPKEIATRWNITNKYYSAEVHLLPVTDQHPQVIDFKAVEAIIIYIHNLKGESLLTAKERKAKFENTLGSSQVNILLCDKCDETFLYDQVTIWCLENDFQLVELLEEPVPTDDTGLIEDHYGLDRVVHILHANTWSNHVLFREAGSESEHHTVAEFSTDDEDELEHMDQFCKMFSKMSSVSSNASSMPSEERKAYAEQVVKAFWKAISGEESELEDMS